MFKQYKTFRPIFLVFLFFGLLPDLHAQDDTRPLPIDPTVRMGVLPNGMRYYIRKNAKPEKRAEFRIAVNAGSTLEEDYQQGLAHFVEHMCFNGTKNFKKNEIVDYLESIGTKFGAHLNAYTSFDETVYMLQAPTDKKEIMDKGLMILEEWAHNVAFEGEEIDKERGVVIEEWRLGRGADARMRDKYFPVLLQNSQYAKRLPIGQKAVLDTAKYEAFRKFYRDWYRTDLMAVIAVGDFDLPEMEKQIKDRFGKIPATPNPKKRVYFDVPDHTETLIAIETDKEAQRNSMQVVYKHPVETVKTYGDYRKKILEDLYSKTLNARLQELTQKPNPPFLYGYNYYGAIVRAKNFFTSIAIAPDNGIEKALETILIENERVRKYGFSATELERAKKETLQEVETAFKERAKTESANFAGEYVSNFLKSEPIPGIEAEFKMYQDFLPSIKVEEVNALAKKFITEENRVVIITAAEKAGARVPTKAEVMQILQNVSKANITAYEDKTTNEPLLAQKPTAGKVVSEKANKDLGITEWTLSNGARVILKPTDFKDDEIQFTSFSPGGQSLYGQKDDVSAGMAGQIINASGIGNFDETALTKKLAGVNVSISPYIEELFEGLVGDCSPKDLETFMQLAYAYFTTPRKDEQAYQSLMTRYAGLLANRDANPQTAFNDTLQVTLAQRHPRRRPFTAALLKEADLNRATEIYKDRFADASDFTFVFVGSFKLLEIKPLIETYLASLPAPKRKENWKDLGVNPPQGIITKTVKKGVEPKSMVSLTFHGPFQWTVQNRIEMDAMMRVLNIKLRENLREDKGGVYGVRASGTPQHFPKDSYKIQIMFGCAPDKADILIDAVFQEIHALKKSGATDKDLQKVKETMRRERETDIKENDFWLNVLNSYYRHGDDVNMLNQYGGIVDKITAQNVQKNVEKYFDEKNYVRVVLTPEK